MPPNDSQQAEKLRASEASLAAAQALAHLGSWELDLATMTGTWSAEMSRLFHRDPALEAPSFAEFLELVHPADRALVEQSMDRVGELQEPLTIEHRTHPDRGPLRRVSATIHVLRDETGRPVRAAGTVLDVTVAREHEREILRISRLYAALSQVNQAIVWTTTRDELFRKICSVLIEFGRFQMAWIGWPEAGTHRLIPVAECGDESGYLQNISVYGDDRPEGRGPVGTAFREGRPCICNDMANSPTTLPWREEIERRGWQACAAFPIRLGGEVCATLAVYADEPSFFQDREIALLVEAAGDISYALDNFAREEARQQVEAKLRQERDFSDAVLSSLPGVLYLYDQTGRFLRWNRNFERVTGYSAAEIATMHPLDFFAGSEQVTVGERIGEVFVKGRASVEAGFLSKDGRVTPYYFTGLLTEIEGQTCLVGVGIDISERKAAEQALRELNETLEQQVAARTAELQSALLRAEVADRLKSAFLATMSHELRTPLNSIIGFTGVVLQELPGPLNAEQKKQLGMVRGSARHLLELINDVLDLSKIEAGQFKARIESFDLPASLERAAASLILAAETKGLTLTTVVAPGLGTMTSDRRRVEQIVLNLLNNAIKFTDRGGVTLTAERVDAPEPALRLRVADTGIGIQPEDLATLFQPFQQVDAGIARQHEGTGLGLAVCRRLATLLGGQIEVTSVWAQGSEFTVTLPLERSPDA